jgi:autotransporter-associated beta strand protein
MNTPRIIGQILGRSEPTHSRRSAKNRGKRIVTLAQASRTYLGRMLRHGLLVWLVGACLGTVAAQEQDATWSPPMGPSRWDNPVDWTPMAVPSATGTATFGASNAMTVTFGDPATVGVLQFVRGAPAYTFDVRSLTVTGTGIDNESLDTVPTFFVGSFDKLTFQGASTAGNATINNTALEEFAGTTFFMDTSTAGHATINNNTGITVFEDTSTAGNAVINNLRGTVFDDASTAGNATMTNNSKGAQTVFNATSTAANSTITNNIGRITFNLTSTAGKATITNNSEVAQTAFNATSTADHSTIINEDGGETQFNATSTAAHSVIENGAETQINATSTAANLDIVTSETLFFNSSTAGEATITTNKDGETAFLAASTAGTATIITNGGGLTDFNAISTGGQARFITNAGGVFDISGLTSGGLTVGSIQGAGTYSLGSKQLTVGGNNLSTVVSGPIADGGQDEGTGGALAKVGTGILTLSGRNTYSGGTSIFAGTLVAAGDNALGSGPAQLLGGTLMIPADVTLSNAVSFTDGGVVKNAGTLNSNILDKPSASETVINSGIIKGNVQLGGSTDIVQLFTGSKITGNLGLDARSSTLILDGGGQQLLSQAVIGTLTNNGTLVKQGSGTWTIDRALRAPLGTDILAGTLVVEAVLTTPEVNIDAGAVLQLNSGGSVGNLVDKGSLIFASSKTVTYGAVIGGPGNVIQDGLGTTILSGMNTYSGGTVIELGTLVANNAQALGTGNVTVNGGVLTTDPQSINVKGNYTQNGGTLQLHVAGANPGQYDTLNVGGNAALGGTLQLISLGFAPQAGNQLTLVSTGGVVSSRFAQFVNPFAVEAGFNTVDLVYGRNSVLLKFLNLIPPVPPVIVTTDFRSFAFTPNQSAAGNLLDAVQLDPKAANLISFLNQEPFANLPNDLQL